MNTFGKIFRLTDFGESHGDAIGGIIDGMPAGIFFDEGLLRNEMKRRKPGGSNTSPRQESDKVEILSGIYNGFSTGAPIGFIIRNEDIRSEDYNSFKAPRPNHADYTYKVKYDGFNDPRGGGRSSARQTACRVVGGAFAKMVLRKLYPTLSIRACLEQSLENIINAQNEGDSIGGVVSCKIDGVPVGIGDPVYGKLQAYLAYAMMGINAAHGFEYGDGFALASAHGSDVADNFITDESGKIKTSTNHSGGIQGGLSNGMPITFRIAFKPTPTFPNMCEHGKMKGRHDPCVALRAVPVVEAMAAITILDSILLSDAKNLFKPSERK